MFLSHFPLVSASSQEIPGERKNKKQTNIQKNIKQNKHFRGSFHSRNHATLQRGDISNCSWDQAHPSSPGQSTCSRLSTSNANSTDLQLSGSAAAVPISLRQPLPALLSVQHLVWDSRQRARLGPSLVRTRVLMLEYLRELSQSLAQLKLNL